MKHVLITGGAGFIGSHLCESLLVKGYAVTALDNYLTGRKKNVDHLISNPNFRLVECDVSKEIPSSKIEFLKTHGLFGLLHFACPASPLDFETIPFDILQVDSLGTIHTVELAIQYGARYLLASTSEVYGDPLVHPQREDYFGNVNSMGPRACYDEAKRFSEAYVSTAMRGIGKLPSGKSGYMPLNAAIVRIFNTYGPRMRPNDGRVVPELCMQALKGNELTIHGDGKQTRSFCYVTDLVDGIVRLFESDLREAVNIGNPVERSILDFAENVIQLTGGKSKLKFLPGRPDDPKQRCPDITKARTKLGWSPKVDLTEGLKKTVEYFRQYS